MADRRVSVEVDANVSPFVRGLTEAGAAAKGFSHELESADSKMNGLVQAGLALAPALVPLGAAAVPAIAGLTTQLGFAVAAGGTAILAFQGVGKALTALNNYQVDPTAANFKKLQETMNTLGPAGAEFVLALQKLRPELQKLQDVAQAGMFPGLTEGLKSLTTLGPEAEQIIGTIASTMGTLAAQAGADIAGPRWQSFFEFLNREAAPTLSAMGHTLGNVVHGLAQMVMAFSPMADSFTQGMLKMSAAFDKWASGLSGSAGFQHFVDYVRTSGPEAMHALGAIADAIIALVQATAPVGQVVLPIITDLAHAFAAIARSPIGTPLIAAAAAFAALAKAGALLEKTGITSGGEKGLGKSFAQAVAPIKAVTTATAELRVAQEELAQTAIRARDAQFALTPTSVKRAALNDYTAAQNKVAVASQKVAEAEKARSASFRETAASIGKGAAIAGAFAIAQTGIADKMHLSNTATLALAGSLAGPWGAAAGAAVGLSMDLASANNDVEDAMKRAGAAAKSQVVDFGAQRTALDDLRAKTDAYAGSVNKARLGGFGQGGASFGDTFNQLSDLFTNTASESRKFTDQQVKDFETMRKSAGQLYATLNNGDLSGFKMTDAELTNFVANVAPALEKAGISVRKYLLDPKAYPQAAGAIAAYNAQLDSAAGKSTAVGKALAGLASQMQSNASAADQLKSAMDSLFGIQLSQSEATDAWTKGLQDLRHQIDQTNGAITGTSKAALANREAVRGSVKALEDKVNADAAAGVSGGKLVSTLLRGRQAIIQQAVAAGASRKSIAAYLNTLGLTPKNLRTIITTPGLLTAKQQVQALGKLYHLTPKEVRTMLRAIDHGMSPTQALKAVYDKLDGRQIRTLLKALTAQANADLARFRAAFDGLNGRVAQTFVKVTTQHIDTRLNAPNRATGGTIPGYSPTKTADNIPIMATAGEFMQPVDSVDYYGLSAMEALRTRRIPKSVLAGYAYGGHIGYATGGHVNNFTPTEFASLVNAFDLAGSIGLKRTKSELASFALGVRRDGGHLGAAFHALSAQAIRVSASYDKHAKAAKDAAAALDKLKSDADQFKGTVGGNFMHNIWGHGATFALQQLGADTTNAKGFGGSLATLQHDHISAALYQSLAESGDIRSAAQLASESPSQLKAFDKAFGARDKAVGALTNQAMQYAFAQRIAQQTALVKAQNAELKHLDATLNRLERAIEKGAHGSVIHVHDKSGHPQHTAKEVARRQRFGSSR